jgi:hypothetical protein
MSRKEPDKPCISELIVMTWPRPSVAPTERWASKRLCRSYEVFAARQAAASFE